MTERTNCECCKKKMDGMFGRKMCTPCSNYTRYIRQRISYYKRQFTIVNKKLYGDDAKKLKDDM